MVPDHVALTRCLCRHVHRAQTEEEDLPACSGGGQTPDLSGGRWFSQG